MSDFSFSWGTPEQKPKDRIYFTSKNSELNELQQELETMKVPNQKEAMKEIIAGMTIGKDITPLFPYVVNCMRTKDVELKKLIYLYIINFAKAKPSESILAVNSFLVDASDRDSPMIRALAIRTMGCIRVDEIVTYWCDTLKNGWRDDDAYVRKTSCICVSKLFCTCPQWVKDNGWIDTLITMLEDGNSIVLSSVIVALTEISLWSGRNYLKISSKILKRIWNALNEANEWGQVYILDCLVNYKNKKTKYAEMIIEATVPWFSHLNPAVIMSAVKVVWKYLDHISDEAKVQNFSKKISMCLVSLMDSLPEMKYWWLRAMHCVIQKRHYLLDKDFKSFFVHAYEPIYVKFEKLDILYKLTDNKNYEMILNELKSYSMLEYDWDLVQRSIKYIGNIGFKYEKSKDLCIDCIGQIYNYNQDFTVDPCVIVTRDWLRKYNKSKKPLELLKKIDDKWIDKIRSPGSKSAALYILGEYAKDIANSTELITLYYNDFTIENEKVKWQILNACIKNFWTKPDDAKSEDWVKSILQKGAEETINADVRDRAYLYWRWLENDPDAAKEMIWAEKESFDSIDEQPIEQELCDDILVNMTNMSCIYQKKCVEMLHKEDWLYDKDEDTTNEDTSGQEQIKEDVKEKEKEKEKGKGTIKKNKIRKDQVNQNDVDWLGLGDVITMSGSAFTTNNPQHQHQQQNQWNNGNNKSNDILDLFSLNANPTPSNNENDIEFLDNPEATSNTHPTNEIIIFTEDNGVSISKPTQSLTYNDKGVNGTCGVSIHCQFHRAKGNILLGLYIHNNINTSLKGFDIKIPENSFCVSYDSSLNPHVKDFSVNSETKKTLIVTLAINKDNNNKQSPQCPCDISVWIKTNIDDFALKVPWLINTWFNENSKMDQTSFGSFFKETNKTKQIFTYSSTGNIWRFHNEEGLNKLIEKNNIFNIARNMKANPQCYYFNCSISGVINSIIEISYKTEDKTNWRSINVGIMTKVPQVIPWIKEALDVILTGK